MINLTKIPENEQESVLGSFWHMLKECEQKADCENDPVLKHLVSEWYKQWNRITNSDNKPIWLTREEQKKEVIEELPPNKFVDMLY